MYDVKKLCEILNISRQGYYFYLKRKKSNRAIENEVLVEEIRKVYTENKGLYGSPRIAIALNNKGIFVSKNRVARLMKKMNLQAKTHKKRHNSYRRVSDSLISDNLLKQNFSTHTKNRVWIGDITYIPTHNRNLYLSSFIDVFTRKVVGWSIGETMHESLVVDSLEKAMISQSPPEGLIVHTDRGSQYTGRKFQSKVTEFGAVSSMSRPGNPYDNALMESFYKSLKTELLVDGKFDSIEKAKNAVFEYIEMFYNTKRLHSSLGYISPNQYESML